MREGGNERGKEWDRIRDYLAPVVQGARWRFSSSLERERKIEGVKE